VDKGTAVAVLAKQKPFAGRAILFGGDDTTDLDVFGYCRNWVERVFPSARNFPAPIMFSNLHWRYGGG
jgi:trehalose-6-phosphatase